MSFGASVLVSLAFFVLCCGKITELEESVPKGPDEAYDALFEVTGYPKYGDMPTLNRKIFKGIRVAIREHPYVVSIRRQLVHFLTASLISKNLVLTVAHPLHGFMSFLPGRIPIHELSVVVGENYADRGTMLLTVILIIIHEDFDPYTLQNDIALVKVYEDVSSKTSVKPIGLVSVSRSLDEQTAFVTGWGRCDTTGRELCLPRTSIYYPDEKFDPMLRTIVFPITFPNFYCDGYKRQGVNIWPGMLCLGVAREENPVAPCLAVAGAPLVVRGRLIGLQSWGFGCGYSHDLPLLYTSTTHHKPWIMHNINILLKLQQSNFTQLFEATRAYFSHVWLDETRVYKVTFKDSPKALTPTTLDTLIAKLRGDCYDIRDFMFGGRYHERKQNMLKEVRLGDTDIEKYNNFTTKTPVGVPFIRKDFLYKDDESGNESYSDDDQLN